MSSEHYDRTPDDIQLTLSAEGYDSLLATLKASVNIAVTGTVQVTIKGEHIQEMSIIHELDPTLIAEAIEAPPYDIHCSNCGCGMYSDLCEHLDVGLDVGNVVLCGQCIAKATINPTTDTTDDIPVEDRCTSSHDCGNKGTSGLHACPFSADIYDDDDLKCNCCSDCQHECSMDI